ncbi:WAT1-related protein At1g68170-like [Triticum dicoccoides]|uniref:WAT1-related protein At1g68170-like n=1 Tax=Triticum dicoccoides TaxID=85692 RepID=UPI00188E0C12|nr:WAT1-related protein At1g68170-like [Triticum dicoccoides]XP_037415866.1 WAT1-related protein At1g68170-like [Triticum dicoccoides]
MNSALPVVSSAHPAAGAANSRRLPSPALHAASTGYADINRGLVNRSAANASKVCALPGQDTDTAVEVQGSSGWKPALCVILVELFNTGTILLGKVALDAGMFVFSLLCYRSMLAAIFIMPFALFLERGKWRELDMKTLGWLFINAFVGYSLPMALYYYGLRDTAASYAVIFSSLTPLFTFILSIILGMEKLRLKSKVGSAKVIGALVCFGGALLISLYKGKELHLWSPIIRVTPKDSNGAAGKHHLRGTLILFGAFSSYALWYPIQVKVLKVYPWKHWSSVLTCVLGGVQTFAIGIIMSRHKLAWQIGWNIQLLTIVYSAALGTAAKYWLNLYAVEKRGPVFPAMFSTLSTIFIIVLGVLLLGESLTVGSLLGSALVLGGLYIYLYGKANEQHAVTASVTGMQKEEDKEIQRSGMTAMTEERPHPVPLESSIIQLDEKLDAGVSK